MAYEYLPEELRNMIGKETEAKRAPVAVERALIDHWVEAYQDANPLYSDEAYAKSSEYGGIIAPPGMLMSWTFDWYWTPDTGPVDREKGMIHYTVKRLLNTPVGVNTGISIDWYLPVRLGDRISYSEVVADVSPLKKTRVGVGHWCTYKMLFRNQNGQLVGEQTYVNYNYTPSEQ